MITKKTKLTSAVYVYKLFRLDVKFQDSASDANHRQSLVHGEENAKQHVASMELQKALEGVVNA